MNLLQNFCRCTCLCIANNLDCKCCDEHFYTKNEHDLYKEWTEIYFYWIANLKNSNIICGSLQTSICGCYILSLYIVPPTPSPSPTLCARGRLNRLVKPPTKLSKRKSLTGPQFLKEGCWKKGGNLLKGGGGGGGLV